MNVQENAWRKPERRILEHIGKGMTEHPRKDHSKRTYGNVWRGDTMKRTGS